MDGIAKQRSFRWAKIALFAGLCLYTALFLYHGSRLALFPYDVDNSEGLLLYQAMRIAEGGFLYRPLDDPPHMVDNYPPVYPMLCALGVAVTGPSFFWPRLISLLATLATAAMLGYWTYLRVHRRDAAWLSALVYLSFYHVYSWGALARVDAVGAAFAIAALVWFERSRARRMEAWAEFPIVATILVLLALFTKQSLFAAPLAILCALSFCIGRVAALRFVGVLAASGIFLFGVMLLLSQGEAFNHLAIYNVNAFFWRDVWLNFHHWFTLYTVWGCAPLAVWLFDRPSRDSDSPTTSPLLFWFCWFALGEALLVGKIGSAPNYFMILTAASSVGVGMIFGRIHAWLDEASGDPRARAAFSFLLAAGYLQLAATVHWPHTGIVFAHTPTVAEARAGEFMDRELRRVEGPVFSDLCGLALRAGHAPVYDPFICTQLVRERKWDHGDFIQQVREGKFERILLHFDLSLDWDRRRFSDELIFAMRDRYTLDRQAGRYFLYRPITPYPNP